MNVRLEDEQEKKKKMKIIYITIISICVILVLAAIIIQVVKNLPKQEKVIDTSKITNSAEEFEKIFTNEVNYLKNNEYKIDKVDQTKQIVYTGYSNKITKVSDYSIDVSVPYINIRNSTIEKFNEEIKNKFETTAKNILNTQSQNTIYTVDYSAYVTNNILSLVVKATLKEGENPQRVIVRTYNYDLANQKEMSFEDLLNFRNITRQEAGNTIKAEIKSIEKTINELAGAGYKVYERDSSSDIYKLDNVTEYFIGKDNIIYVIFAYGNKNNTSEVDIVTM